MDDTGQSPSDAGALRLGVAQVFAYRGEMDPAIGQFAAFRVVEIVVALESNVTGPFRP